MNNVICNVESTTKGNTTIADLRYKKKGLISPSTLNFFPIEGSLGIYTLHIPLRYCRSKL